MPKKGTLGYKTTKKKKKKAPPHGGWEWLNDDAEWCDFAKEDCKLLEDFYQDDVTSFVTKDFSWNLKHKTLYKINFATMTQTNQDSGVCRELRRTGPPKKKAKKAKKTSKKEVKDDGNYHWEYMDDDDMWEEFNEEDSEMMEERYAEVGSKGVFSTTEFSFNKNHGSVYVVNFRKGTQRNAETNVVRKIKRVKDSTKSSSSSGKAKKNKGGKIVWQWWTDDDEWANFDAKDAKLLETAHSLKTGAPFSTRDLSFNEEHQSLYIFDFLVMSQSNNDSGTSRKIRRLCGGKAKGHDKGEDDGYTSVLGSADWSSPISIKASSSAPTFEPSISSTEIKKQKKLGAQSKRGWKKYDYGPTINGDKHGRKCFDEMLANEERFCGEWTVFYHSYSAAALMYEVQAAVAAVLFRFKSQFATLPRILWKPFNDIPDAKAMLKEFPTWPDQDHNPRFRAVGICGTSSLLAPDSEAPPKSVFLMGYSVGPLTGILEKLLKACGVPAKAVKMLAKKIVKLAERHGLDARGHGGKMCKSGRAGHMLQIFIRRELVDKYVYPSHPYGVPDPKRDPLGSYLSKGGQKSGQIRITVNPEVFLLASCVRMFVFSADPTFHKNREDFQEELRDLLDEILMTDETRVKAAKGIFGGKLPKWWSSEDQTDASKMTKKRYLMSTFD